MSTQSTPIQRLLIEEEEENKLQQTPQRESPQRESPQMVATVHPPPVPQNKKEFFGLKDFDYKSTLLVFVIVFILTSSMFSTLSRTYISGYVGPEGRITIMGTFIAAIIGTLMFVITKMFIKC